MEILPIPLDQDYFNTLKKEDGMQKKEKLPKAGEIRYHRVNTVLLVGSEASDIKYYKNDEQ